VKFVEEFFGFHLQVSSSPSSSSEEDFSESEDLSESSESDFSESEDLSESSESDDLSDSSLSESWFFFITIWLR